MVDLKLLGMADTFRNELPKSKTPSFEYINLDVTDPSAHRCAGVHLLECGAFERALPHRLNKFGQPVQPTPVQFGSHDVVIARGVVCIGQRHQHSLVFGAGLKWAGQPIPSNA